MLTIKLNYNPELFNKSKVPVNSSTNSAKENVVNCLAEAWKKLETLHGQMTSDIAYQLHKPVISLLANLNSATSKIASAVKETLDPASEAASAVNKTVAISKEFQKIKVLSLFPTLFFGFAIQGAVKQFESATKAREYAEAFGNLLGVVKDVINIPKDVIEVCALFDGIIAEATQLSAWAPGISVASALLSIAAIGLKANDIQKGVQFTNRMERKSAAQAIKQLVMSLESQPDAYEKMLHNESLYKDLTQACEAVRDADTMLLLKMFRQELKKENPSAELMKAWLEVAKESQTFNSDALSVLEAMLTEKACQDATQDPAIRKQRASEVDQLIGSMRQLRDNVPLAKIANNLKTHLEQIDPSLLPMLNEAADRGYLNALKGTQDKVIKRHYGIPGSDIKESIERIEKASSAVEKSNPQEARELKQMSVRLLKEQHEKKMLSDKLAISASVIGLVASVILLALGFGLTCPPLSIVAVLLMTIVICLSIAKISYDYVSNKQFADAFGISENKLCKKWQTQLKKIEADLEGGSDVYQKRIQDLKLAIDNRDFNQQLLDLSLEQKADEKHQKAAKEINRIIEAMNKWQRQKTAEPDKYLLLSPEKEQRA